MNQWHLVKALVCATASLASPSGGPLTEWFPSVRFISAKGPPEGDAGTAPQPATALTKCH
jgi:hypothetical protein